MAKAYNAIKNFQFKEVLNLVCYGAKHPEMLTQTQRITRLYRSVLRRQNQLLLEGLQGDVHKFNDELQAVSSEFYHLMNLNRGFASTPSIILHPCRRLSRRKSLIPNRCC